MLAYTLRRLVAVILAFFVLTYFIYLLTTREGIFVLHHFAWGSLLPRSYELWLGRVLHGNLGYSIRAHADVLSAMRGAVGVSLLLIIPAFVLQELIAVALGLFAGSRYGSFADRAISVFSFIGISTPSFWLALIAIEVFAVQAQLLPATGLVDYHALGTAFATPDYWAYFHANTGAALLDLGRHLALPVGVLAITGIAADNQLVRLSLVEVLNQDYIRAARARGLRERTVLWKHAFRNILVPFITNVSLQLPRLVFAAMLVELVFALPGLGHLFASAIYTPGAETAKSNDPVRLVKDYDVISAYFLALGVLTLLTSFVTDLIYASADPRIRTATNMSPVAPNPLTSTQPLFAWGKVRVQVRAVALAGLALVIIGAGWLVGRQVLQPSPPPLSGTWSGTVNVTGEFLHSQLPLIMTLRVDGNGSIRGTGYDCGQTDFSTGAILETFTLFGTTDLTNSVSIAWVGPTKATTFTYNGFAGAYPHNGHLTLQGQVLNNRGQTLPAVMQFQRGGDVRQFQATCK